MKKTALLLSLLPVSLFSQFRAGGAFENKILYADGADYDAVFANNSQVRLNLEYKDTSWRIFSDLRFNLFYGYDAVISYNPNAFLYSTQNGKNNFALSIEAPRLYLKASSKAGNFTVGRSYLNFGQPQLFNALEWHKNFNLTDPNAIKPGINMIAWDIGLGSYGKMKAFIGGDDTWDYPLGGVEIIFGGPSFEMGVAYQYKGDDRNVIGLNFKADLILTFFGTYAAHLNQVTSGKGFQQFHDFSLGFDYSFLLNTSTMVITQIFYYNSSGAGDKLYYSANPRADYYFMARSYSHSTLSFSINEFISFGASVMVNMVDGSGAVLPTGTFTLVNNLVFEATMGIFFGGKGTEFGPNENVIPNVNALIKLIASF